MAASEDTVGRLSAGRLSEAHIAGDSTPQSCMDTTALSPDARTISPCFLHWPVAGPVCCRRVAPPDSSSGALAILDTES